MTLIMIAQVGSRKFRIIHRPTGNGNDSRALVLSQFAITTEHTEPGHYDFLVASVIDHQLIHVASPLVVYDYRKKPPKTFRRSGLRGD
jgi:hypothetical protein